MSIKIGINGFGRIGRNVFRAISLDQAFKAWVQPDGSRKIIRIFR